MTITINIDQLSDDELYRIYISLKAKFDQEEMNILLNRELRDDYVRIELNIRIIYHLMASGILTIKDLIACTRADLLKIKGIGSRSMEEIERVVRFYGLELAGR
jgi:DNA-directed RNA polymerase alpha subunit